MTASSPARYCCNGRVSPQVPTRTCAQMWDGRGKPEIKIRRYVGCCSDIPPATIFAILAHSRADRCVHSLWATSQCTLRTANTTLNIHSTLTHQNKVVVVMHVQHRHRYTEMVSSGMSTQQQQVTPPTHSAASHRSARHALRRSSLKLAFRWQLERVTVNGCGRPRCRGVQAKGAPKYISR
jgi:hypothetical protein